VLELLPDAEACWSTIRARIFSRDRRMLGEPSGLNTGAGRLLENEKLTRLLMREPPVILGLGRGGRAALARFGRIGPALSALFQQHNRFEALLTSSAPNGAATV